MACAARSYFFSCNTCLRLHSGTALMLCRLPYTAYHAPAAALYLFFMPAMRRATCTFHKHRLLFATARVAHSLNGNIRHRF